MGFSSPGMGQAVQFLHKDNQPISGDGGEQNRILPLTGYLGAQDPILVGFSCALCNSFTRKTSSFQEMEEMPLQESPLHRYLTALKCPFQSSRGGSELEEVWLVPKSIGLCISALPSLGCTYRK